MANALAQQSVAIAANERRILELTQRKDALADKLARYHRLLDAPGTMSTTLIAKELGITADTLNKKLKEKNIQFKQGGNWMLKSPYDKKGYVQYRTLMFGEETKRQMMWTEKGRMFIHELLS